MDYFEKIEENPYKDLFWNIPERKQGSVNIIGGNSHNFRAEVRVAEFLTSKYPIEAISLVLPDALENRLPAMPNFAFMPSTESGSFTDSQELTNKFNASDFNLVLGDLSKNTITGQAISQAIKSTEKMTLITRDSVDLISDNNPDRLLMNENLIFFASLMQLQKLFRAVYYPKMLLASQSLIQVVEVLHKFTLSYPVTILTLHNGQLILAMAGTVKAVPLDKTGYSPIEVWSGELSAKIVAMNLYNPSDITKATISALIQD